MLNPTAIVQATAQQLLSATLGSAVTLDEGMPIDGRPHVLRFYVLNGPSSAPTSVIVKKANLRDGLPYNPNELEGPAVQFFDDIAGVQFLTRVAGNSAICPRFYAWDREAGLFILEDIKDMNSLEPLDTLLGDDPILAETLLIAQATTLGQMHACTIGQQATYHRIRDPLGRRGGEKDIHGYFYGYDWILTALDPTLAALSMTASPALIADLKTLVATLQNPGPFLAYTHGDPCPDNGLWDGSTLRLIDFERSAFRHALLDGVFSHMDFPSCWCANHIPRAIVQRIEDAYRVELKKVCPEAADDTLFFQGIAAACAYWILSMVQRYDLPSLLHADSQWGLTSLRQRLLTRLQTFVEITRRFGYLEPLGATLASILEQLRKEWPSEIEGMPVYPAFR